MPEISLQKEPIKLDKLWFDAIWTAAQAFQAEPQLMILGGRGSRHTLIALSWDEVPWTEFVAEAPTSEALISSEAWTTGQLAIVGYDRESRVLRLKRTLIIDHSRREAEICRETGWESCRYQIEFPPQGANALQREDSSPQWKSTWTDAAYLEAVREALEDIRRGRYYQINLLRYWFSEQTIHRDQWLAQLAKTGGPFSAYLEIPGLQLVSFSPERFFRIRTGAEGRIIETEPIKGTRPVAADPEEDSRQRAALLASDKDAAELNMIVDLLRNDLFRVCQPSSVRVLDPGSLQSFANVHHRVARIQGLLQEGVSLGGILEALCPGGSITGAPKHEVMQAIREKECRPRGWFMGNIIYKDAFTGRLDSSILIRTAVREENWEFAAGSGLVIHSDPVEELAEVRVKAKVLLGDFV